MVNLTLDDKRLVELYDEDNDLLGLYLVNVKTHAYDFKTEFRSFENQSDFDDNNTIGAERIFVHKMYL